MSVPLPKAALPSPILASAQVTVTGVVRGGDPDELHEAARELALEEFEDWQRADYDRREFEDFGNWLANKARWNRPNIYEVAMTAAEGGARLSRVELVAHSKNQRQFNRQCRAVRKVVA